MSERASTAAAWSVHLLTASGVVWGLLALDAAIAGRYGAALRWMFVAVLVDGLDGPLARRFQVARVLPGVDGALLDNVVDYFNYVVVPAVLIQRAAALPEGLGLAGAAWICLASAIQFSRSDAKTADHYFRGFPSYWNVLALYLLVLRPDPRLALGVVGLLGVLALVPLRCIYPSRTVELRRTTWILTALWTLCLVLILIQYPEPWPWLVRGSLAYVGYYAVASCLLTFRRAKLG